VTPKNKGNFPWAGKDFDQFENDFSFKPVTIKGYFDHEREYKVETQYRGEKGVQIITPFYTHLDASGNPCAIFVNRGWIPYDLKDSRLHYQTGDKVTGYLHRGQPENKYSLPNNPTINDFHSIRLKDFVIVSQLPNAEEASQFMLKQYDTDADKRQSYPSILTIEETAAPWKLPVERNGAYEGLWRAVTFAGVLANTAAWLYF
jgi:cytochrome oxidase assembly protein ShyY1